MAIAFRSITTLNYGSHTSPTVLTAPAGLADGDILIAVVNAGGSTSGADNDITPPAGFTAVTTATEVSGVVNVKNHVFWKRASSESGSYSFTHNAGATRSTGGALVAYAGCIASGNPVDMVSTNSGTGTSATALSVTTTVADTMLVIAGHNFDAFPTIPPDAPAGFTSRFSQITVVKDGAQAPSGASGDKVYVSGSTGGSPWQAWMLALKPVAASGGGGGGGAVKVWDGSAWVGVDSGVADAPDSQSYVRTLGAWVLGYTKAAIDALLGTKLNSSAYTAADVLAKLITVDGAGSGLDADLLDGFNSTTLPVSTAQAAADGLRVLKAGDTMTGALTVSPASGPGEVNVDSVSGQLSALNLKRGGLLRWVVDANTTAEGGSNTGSNFNIVAYNDAGTTPVITAFSITRNTGVAQMQQMQATAKAAIYTASAIPAGGAAGAGYLMSSTANFGVFFGSGAPTLTAAKGSHYLRSDGAVGSYTYVNTDGATTWAPLLDDGAGVLKAGDTMTGNLTIAKATPALAIDKAASGQEAGLQLKTATVLRWKIIADNTAESAGTGSHFRVTRHDDAGALIENAVTINRSTGGVSFSRALNVAANVAPVAGGSATSMITIGNTSIAVIVGSGAPTLSAAKGSLYLRSDGTSNVTRMYVNTDGAATWTAVNTVA